MFARVSGRLRGPVAVHATRARLRSPLCVEYATRASTPSELSIDSLRAASLDQAAPLGNDDSIRVNGCMPLGQHSRGAHRLQCPDGGAWHEGGRPVDPSAPRFPGRSVEVRGGPQNHSNIAVVCRDCHATLVDGRTQTPRIGRGNHQSRAHQCSAEIVCARIRASMAIGPRIRVFAALPQARGPGRNLPQIARFVARIDPKIIRRCESHIEGVERGVSVRAYRQGCAPRSARTGISNARPG